MSFQLLNESIQKSLTLCGYTNPTPIQTKAIPIILEGKDLAASSQTGSGKTAAFVLPALHRLSLQKSNKKTRILVLTPTRELAHQIQKAARDFGRFEKVNIISLVGGMAYGPQIKDLSRGADIIIATPGRLMDHIEHNRIDLSQIEMLILDEADRMLDMGFIEDVEYIAKLTPKARQTLLFSATLDKKLMTIVRHLLKDPVRIDLSEEKLAPKQIKQEFYRVNNVQQKSRVLKQLLSEGQIFKAIIFSATKINADRLAEQLRDDGFLASALHGDLRQNVRNRTIEQVRRGKIQYLVATDVAARGIDIHDITHVINYDLPRFSEDYVHRIGRTGRAGKEGIAISFVQSSDMRHLKAIEKYLGLRVQVKDFHIKSDSHHEKKHHEFIEPEFKPYKEKSIKKENSRGHFKNHREKEDEHFRFERRKNKSNQFNKDKFGERSFKKSHKKENDYSHFEHRKNKENKFKNDKFGDGDFKRSRKKENDYAEDSRFEHRKNKENRFKKDKFGDGSFKKSHKKENDYAENSRFEHRKSKENKFKKDKFSDGNFKKSHQKEKNYFPTYRKDDDKNARFEHRKDGQSEHHKHKKSSRFESKKENFHSSRDKKKKHFSSEKSHQGKWNKDKKNNEQGYEPMKKSGKKPKWRD